jgi:CheY-like chemotaxis protein/anti-sigma regulatory factor (Ser/Thr protein kinase)
MNREAVSILVVDDEVLNLMLISEYLRETGMRIATAKDGMEAWEKLQAGENDFDVVLLDLMMPRMDGMEVLRRIKSHPRLQVLPVILQTALAAPDDIHQGIRAGAHYYLTKPFEKEMLRSVVATAAQDRLRYRRMQAEIARTERMFGLMRQAEFRFRSMAEGRGLSSLLANACPEPSKAVIGIAELLVNAVEHGNLGIGYREKGRLLENGGLDEEIERRLQDPARQNLRVNVSYQRSDSQISIRITDQGQGFDWKNYADVDASRVFDAHGRGIAVARIMSFDRLEFSDKGNEVTAIIDL